MVARQTAKARDRPRGCGCVLKWVCWSADVVRAALPARRGVHAANLQCLYVARHGQLPNAKFQKGSIFHMHEGVISGNAVPSVCLLIVNCCP